MNSPNHKSSLEDMVQDTPRIESSDADKRSNVVFKVSATNDSQSDQFDSNNMMELSNSKDDIMDIRVENRDSKSDAKYDSRIYDNKDVDTKGELNLDKNVSYSVSNSPLTLKEQHSVKVDSPAARNPEEGLNVDVREENMKGDDKHKDIDRKRKELVNGSDKEANKSVELLMNKDDSDTMKMDERDANAESERPDKRIKVDEKESEDVEKERECGVHQREKIIPRRESLALMFEPHEYDNERSQGPSDPSSSVVYKIDDCVQEILKLWKEYEESSATDKSCETGPTLEIRIPAEHVTATNEQVRSGQLWGTDVYTIDSDIVAVLTHTGYCRPTASPPPSAAQELRATIRLLPPKDGYVSSQRNNVRSRSWGPAIGCSYRVEHCCIVKKEGGIIPLTPYLTYSSSMEPTLAPVAMERKMKTRAAASSALRQQRFVREVTIQFNLCMEPWLKYSISVVADKGFKKHLFTSSRLKKGEVLYVETHSRRYELCFSGEKSEHGVETVITPTLESPLLTNDSVDLFRWSRCKRPMTQNAMKKIGIPLPAEHVEVLEDNLEWDDIAWSQTGVWIRGREYHLARAHFMSTN